LAGAAATAGNVRGQIKGKLTINLGIIVAGVQTKFFFSGQLGQFKRGIGSPGLARTSAGEASPPQAGAKFPSLLIKFEQFSKYRVKF
jgi:hypothetical protein